MRAPRRPVLRYHGGKWRLAPWVIAHLPPHRVYVEPFGGGASVLMRKTRSYAEVYNDLDDEIVNVFRVLRAPALAEELRRLVALTPFSRVEFEASYEVGRGDEVERARLTLVRSFMGFGSNSIQASRGRTGFRANALRQGTVPASDWANWPAQIPAFVERLRGVAIENRPAVEVIAQQDSPGTLFYVDPPYTHGSRSGGNLYDKKHFYRHEMTDAEHAELAATLHRLEGMVVLSAYPSALYTELYGDWRSVKTAALADGARKRTEVLYISPAADELLAPQLFAHHEAVNA